MANQGKFSQSRSAGTNIQPQQTPAAAVKKNSNKRKRKKANRAITLIFYTCYFVITAAILAGLFFLRSWLSDRLAAYEGSLPPIRSEEIFRENFADPDWEKLYAMAGLTDTEYEGSEAFTAYMEARVGTGKLSYAETSAGLSGDHKYLLKLGDETIGFFILENRASRGTPDWQLGSVELTCAYDQSVTIRKPEGITVCVNGVALTDDHTIRISITGARDQLSGDAPSFRIHTQYLDGLMAKPVITATDEDGNPVDISYDVDSDCYVVLAGGNSMISGDIREQSSMVRLTFLLGETVVFTNLYAEDAESVHVPTVTAPQGQVFAGWFCLDTNPDGSKEYTKVFDSSEHGVVRLSADTKLQPMTLYALFENAPENGGNE